MTKLSIPNLLKELWGQGFFSSEKTFPTVRDAIGRLGSHPSDANLGMALGDSDFLTRRGKRGKFRYIQKYAPKGIVLTADILPDELISALGQDFETEIADLRINYGRSGTCTAFLLRKVLEKLIFLTFAKNGEQDKLEDKQRGGELVGLKTMLTLATAIKVAGKPFLMPRTAKEIEGIKFLGDASAHNPLANVSMKTIVPVMPYIITAYTELSKKL